MTYFVYDEVGQLLGEYDETGQMLREYIWLENKIVGMVSSQQANKLLRVHTDHLGTVRAVSSASIVLWRWEGDAFGSVLPNGDVDGNSQLFTMPVRHAGQYYDPESGLFYNYYRDYDPASGRYVESDPIGLRGGLNTYGYVGGNPLSWVDVLGLLSKWNGADPASDALGSVCIECLILPASKAPKLFKWLKNACPEKEQEPAPLPKPDIGRLKRDKENLEQVMRELRKQLDNGRAQAAREIAKGHTPNPHGLGKEINESIPNEIRSAERKLGEINKALKDAQ